jgi:hypothetical protein
VSLAKKDKSGRRRSAASGKKQIGGGRKEIVRAARHPGRDKVRRAEHGGWRSEIGGGPEELHQAIMADVPGIGVQLAMQGVGTGETEQDKPETEHQSSPENLERLPMPRWTTTGCPRCGQGAHQKGCLKE